MLGLDQPVGPVGAEALLVDIDVYRILGVENVVKSDEHDTGLLRPLDHRPEGLGVLGVDDDGIILGIDEVVDRGDLGGDVLAGRHHLEFLELCLDVRLSRIRLGGLDHLNAPEVRDEAVGERDPVGALLLRELEEFRIRRPRYEALRILAWTGNDFRCRSGRGGESKGDRHGGGNAGDIFQVSLGLHRFLPDDLLVRS